MSAAIVIEQVAKQFPKTKALAVNHVDLTIEKGEFVTILGTSGSGKTTLLKMINRLIEPTSGTIYLNGQATNQMTAVTLRRQIGYVLQQIGLFDHLSIYDNIATVPKLLGWDKVQIKQRVEALLDLIKLPQEFATRFPHQLSGGQRQRIGIARALAADPDVLLMDEPFGALDVITRTHLQEELLQIQQTTGKTILFVTHDLAEAFKLGSKVVVMDQGTIQQIGKPVDILLHPASRFVKQLVNSEDWLAQLNYLTLADLSLVKVAAESKAQILTSNTSLADVLKKLLAHPEQTFLVDYGEKEPLVQVTVEDFSSLQRVV